MLSHLQVCDPSDCSPSGSSVHGIFQTRILEWAAMSSSRGSFSNPGTEPACPALQADSLLLSHQGREFKKQGYLLKHEDIKTYDGNEKLLKDIKEAEWQNQNL